MSKCRGDNLFPPLCDCVQVTALLGIIERQAEALQRQAVLLQALDAHWKRMAEGPGLLIVTKRTGE